MQNAWNDLISESSGMPQSRLCLLNLREGAWTALPGLAQPGWHHVPFPAQPHHFSLNCSLSHLSSNHRADLFFVLGICHYHRAVSIQKCLSFPLGLLSGCQWGTSTAKESLCMASCCGIDEQRMCWGPAFFWLLLNYKNFSWHLALQPFLLSLFFFFLVPDWRSGAKWWSVKIPKSELRQGTSGHLSEQVTAFSLCSMAAILTHNISNSTALRSPFSIIFTFISLP